MRVVAGEEQQCSCGCCVVRALVFADDAFRMSLYMDTLTHEQQHHQQMQNEDGAMRMQLLESCTKGTIK